MDRYCTLKISGVLGENVCINKCMYTCINKCISDGVQSVGRCDAKLECPNVIQIDHFLFLALYFGRECIACIVEGKVIPFCKCATCSDQVTTQAILTPRELYFA